MGNWGQGSSLYGIEIADAFQGFCLWCKVFELLEVSHDLRVSTVEGWGMDSTPTPPGLIPSHWTQWWTGHLCLQTGILDSLAACYCGRIRSTNLQHGKSREAGSSDNTGIQI